ncbi:MAG: DUF3341 domain-containing protein [Bdellovibrionales bacterium]|nr:DUF3341 domain-containing protein [Bdellovibrionales bacterium]
MSKEYAVIGHFRFIDETKRAVRHLRESDRGEDMILYSPAPFHELEDEAFLGKRRSPVRMFTLFGGITGCLGAFLMTTWMSVDYPLRTSAKPLMSIPAFVVIAFECTILLGALFTLVGMLHNSRLPDLFRKPGFKPNFTEGTFGVVCRVEKNEAEGMRAKFEEFGAEKVEIEYVR